MATVYLHIGMPKTGTTAIQNFMALNRDLLAEKGVSYPDMGFHYPGRGYNRNAFFLHGEGYNAEGAERCDWREKPEYPEGMKQLSELGRKFETIVISDEGNWWGGVRRKKFWPMLKQDMDAAGLELKVIVYLRRQEDFAQSHYEQRVKEGFTHSFEEYLVWKDRAEYPFDYEATLAKIAESVGSENIIVRVYEKGQFQGEEHTIFSDFLEIFGLKMADGFELENTVRNVSLEGDALELRRALNRVPEMRGVSHRLTLDLKRVQEIEDYAWKRGQEMYFASEDAFEAFKARYAEGNAAVARKYLGREDGKLFQKESHALTPHVYNEKLLVEELSVLLAYNIIEREKTEKALKDECAKQRAELKALKKELRDTKKEIQQDLLWFRAKRKARHLMGKDK
ncbi:MAG: hypothetical protein Q4B01_03715 [Eubacteriales bacterium]|nr:hypothetical protein [Eubacteriales bacterium]